MNILGLSPLAREHMSALSDAISVSGLSPLAREHARPRRSESIHAGLSRWRGNTQPPQPPGGRSAVYPAGAGNTKGVRTQLVLDAVYPRWRGNTDAGQQERPREPVYPAGAGNA
ncbi:hypothetical protein JS561_08560 [Salmonella enterica subsp. enterica serovar Infantis]|nr:hypothetical protein JS561_08560 [Salmonella enterica subsp. enterica serovar Infantis]